MVNRGEELLPGVGGRVLLIEDRPEVIATVSRSLAERGYRTQTVASVADATLGVQHHEVALVLLRYCLFERLGGKDFLDIIRAESPRRRLSIIALLDAGADWSAASRLDFEDYLPDPFPVEDLVHLVDENCR
mgnify:FL=1